MNFAALRPEICRFRLLPGGFEITIYRGCVLQRNSRVALDAVSRTARKALLRNRICVRPSEQISVLQKYRPWVSISYDTRQRTKVMQFKNLKLDYGKTDTGKNAVASTELVNIAIIGTNLADLKAILLRN